LAVKGQGPLTKHQQKKGSNIMLTVKDLQEILKNVPDDTPVLTHIDVQDSAYIVRDAKYITDKDDGPYDDNGCIKHAVVNYGGVVVISNWKF
jgi:hypothetical protein